MDERLYADLAPWWGLLSPPEHYGEEAELYLDLLSLALGRPPATMLELGSGGGHLAVHMPPELDLVLVDRSAEMLAQSRALNPERSHVQADMRRLDLGRRFEAVLLHDAVMYLVEPEDLASTFAAVARHLVPGGAFLVLPDVVRETFAEGIMAGGSGPDWAPGAGRAARMLEWHWDPDPTDSSYRVDMSFLLRDEDGRVHTVHDVHTMALHSRDSYWAALRAAGFQPVEAPPLPTDELGEVFLVRLPG